MCVSDSDRSAIQNVLLFSGRCFAPRPVQSRNAVTFRTATSKIPHHALLKNADLALGNAKPVLAFSSGIRRAESVIYTLTNSFLHPLLPHLERRHGTVRHPQVRCWGQSRTQRADEAEGVGVGKGAGFGGHHFFMLERAFLFSPRLPRKG